MECNCRWQRCQHDACQVGRNTCTKVKFAADVVACNFKSRPPGSHMAFFFVCCVCLCCSSFFCFCFVCYWCFCFVFRVRIVFGFLLSGLFFVVCVCVVVPSCVFVFFCFVSCCLFLFCWLCPPCKKCGYPRRLHRIGTILYRCHILNRRQLANNFEEERQLGMPNDYSILRQAEQLRKTGTAAVRVALLPE